MQSIPDGVDLYVHRLIHESLMKEVIREYHSLYESDVDGYDMLGYKESTNFYAANYRTGPSIHEFNIMYRVNGLMHDYYDCDHSDEEVVELPKRYYFSSGMNSCTGYFKF